MQLIAGAPPISMKEVEIADGTPEDSGGDLDTEGRGALASEFEYHSNELDLTGDPGDGNWSIRCLDVYKRLGSIVLNGAERCDP